VRGFVFPGVGIYKKIQFCNFRDNNARAHANTTMSNALFVYRPLSWSRVSTSKDHSRLLRTKNLSSSLRRRRTSFVTRQRISNDADFDAKNNTNNNKIEAKDVLSFLCPLLKLVSGGDAAKPRNRTFEVATSGFASMARIQYGKNVLQEATERTQMEPPPKLILYEFEACPFCRRVRETLSMLDLDCEIRPCPKDGTFRKEVLERGGKETFPYFVDETTGKEMYESADIVNYLYKTYGNGADLPENYFASTLITGWMPTLFRAGRGMTKYEPRKEGFVKPQVPSGNIELFNYENNQFARLCREALCELELPYTLRNVGAGSPKRETLTEAGGKSVPFLIDGDVKIGESEEIVAYLFEKYGGGYVPEVQKEA
jgi:glutathione S-transferase